MPCLFEELGSQMIFDQEVMDDILKQSGRMMHFLFLMVPHNNVRMCLVGERLGYILMYNFTGIRLSMSNNHAIKRIMATGEKVVLEL